MQPDSNASDPRQPLAPRQPRTPRTARPPRERPVKHSRLEDAFGLFTGAFVVSFGLFLLKASGAVTGGTAGLALLLSYSTPVSFSIWFVLVNAPFIALAFWKKGVVFTVRTIIAVVIVSLLAYLHPTQLDVSSIGPVYGTLTGNLLVGIGLLIIFRHRASLGGINIVALLVQDKTGFKAGYVQMIFDVIIVASAFAVVSPLTVLLSALGAVLLNLVLAINHRPDRYIGH